MAGFGSTTQGSVTYRWIVTNHDDIVIKDIGTTHIGNASGSPYGINGTFFYNGTPHQDAASDGYKAYDNYRICMQGSTAVRARGEINRLNGPNYGACGTLVWLKAPLTQTGAYHFCSRITDFSNLTIEGQRIMAPNVKWAIGGTHLYLNTSPSQASFNTEAKAQDPTAQDTHCRSAIFYKPVDSVGHDIVLLSAFGSSNTGTVGSSGGVTLWDLRSFIRNQFGTSCQGIAVDGGGSTQMAFKNNANQRVLIQAEQRQVRTMITTPM